MDKDTYPGDRVMQSLIINTNLTWTGFYLTPAPSQGHKLGWMGKHDFLRGLGWGIAPVYVGRQIAQIKGTDHRMAPENGTRDGTHAAGLASSAGFGSGVTVFLDFEHGPPLKEEVKAYYAAWADALRTRGFKPGVYCLSGIAGGLAAKVPGGSVWTVNLGKIPGKSFKSPFPNPDPAQSGIGGASMWQLKQQVTIEYEHLDGGKKHLVVDLNSALTADPSGIGTG
jgi:hypothetical protein